MEGFKGLQATTCVTSIRECTHTLSLHKLIVLHNASDQTGANLLTPPLVSYSPSSYSTRNYYRDLLGIITEMM